MGCRRCENCIRGLYTACLNYGNTRRGHRANGFTTNGGLAEYALNHINTLYRIPDGVSYEEATVVMTAGSPLFGLENAGGYFAGTTVACARARPHRAHDDRARQGAGGHARDPDRHARVEAQHGRQLGADVVVNSTTTDLVAAVMDAHARSIGATSSIPSARPSTRLSTIDIHMLARLDRGRLLRRFDTGSPDRGVHRLLASSRQHHDLHRARGAGTSVGALALVGRRSRAGRTTRIAVDHAPAPVAPRRLRGHEGARHRQRAGRRRERRAADRPRPLPVRRFVRRRLE